MTPALNWAIYARKSTESEERQIQSIPDQLRYFDEVARKEKLKISETITDAKSAKLPDNREGFERLVKLIEKGKINGILCWKLNRLSRNPVDGGRIHWLLQTGKIKCIKTCDRCYYPEDNVLFFAVELGMANQEVRDLAKNVARGLESKANKGWYPCIPPIGYLNSKYGRKGEEVILEDPERFLLVRKMWDLMLTGCYTPMEIRRIATHDWKLRTAYRKTKGRQPIAPSAIYNIFTNLFYTGYFNYKGTIYKGKHTPMVSAEEFERVQILLGRKSLPKPHTHDFAFTGMMKCSECGAAITASAKRKLVKSTGQYKTYTYYHCTRRMGIDDCKAPPVKLEDLEQQIATLLRSYTISPRRYQLGLHILESNLTHDPTEQHILKQQIALHIQGLEGKLEKLMTLLLNETISESDYTQRKQEIERQLALEKLKQEGQPNAKRSIKQTTKALHFASCALDAFMTGDNKTKKKILLTLGSNYTLSQKKLCVQMRSWLEAVKKFDDCCSDVIGRFELEKANLDKGDLAFCEFSTELCGAIDDVRTVVSEMPDDYWEELSSAQPSSPTHEERAP